MNFGGFCHTIIMFRYWKKNMELSEPSLIREMLYQKTVFDSLRYKPEEVLEKILGVMK